MSKKGYKQTEEHKNKISYALLGKPKSQESKRKMSETKKLQCEELWNINNGITLCLECHGKTKKAVELWKK